MTTPMQSWSFVVFAAMAVLLYWLAIPRRWRPHYLLTVSLGYFLACSLDQMGLPFVFLLFYLYGMFVIGILIDTAKTPQGRRRWTVLGVVAAAGILVLFKTIATLTKVLVLLLGPGLGEWAAAGLTKFGVPIGISYFSFRVIHYLVEVYRGKERRATALEFFLYVTFFPTMVAGPIHRFFTLRREKPEDSFGVQVRGEGGLPPFKFDDISYGVWRILQGVVKKFVIADFFYRLCTPMLQPALLLKTEWWQMWMAAHAYFVYLYIDFSGYSDIAIGISRLFGIRVMENFNWGLFAVNVQDFWRRWHISLTQWLMNYIYFPLGGGRKGEFRTDVNAMITIIAVAVWHRVSVSMFIWGFLQGLAVVFVRHYLKLKKRLFPNHRPTLWGKALGVVCVWHWQAILWPLFHHPTRIAILYWVKMSPVIPLLKWLGVLGGADHGFGGLP
jgi:alginate O-acetyltransferase complex protein AlgI